VEDFDYYTVMEKRIKYLSKKYDPNKKFPLEWELKREEQKYPHTKIDEPIYKNRFARQFSEIFNSVIAFLF